MMRTLAVAGGLFLTGCNLFVGPPVECSANRLVINLEQTASPARDGVPCVFADPFPFTVSYTPRADRSLLGTDGLPRFGESDDRMLVGQSVSVVQGSAATLLCAGVGDVCTDGAASINTTIGTSGTLAYQGLFTLEPLGVVLNPGDTFRWEGVLATENFGPGNSCPLTAKVNLLCQKAQ
jgi:hypothetical protein